MSKFNLSDPMFKNMEEVAARKKLGMQTSNLTAGTQAANLAVSQLSGGKVNAASGAAQGAAMGSFLGPKGAVIGGVIGGISGAIGASAAKKKAKAQAQADKFQKLQQIESQTADRRAMAIRSLASNLSATLLR